MLLSIVSILMELDPGEGRAMKTRRPLRLISMTIGGGVITVAALLGSMAWSRPADAACQHCGSHWPWHHCCHNQTYYVGPGDIQNYDVGGSWYWMRSPEEEQRVVASIYNRYCIRCHGVDGRGVWDIPCVPDFTNVRWQISRPDDYRARIIMEGRGAVMPPFRGTLTYEEACAMARYLHSFVPEAAVSRPDLGPPTAPAATAAPLAPAVAPAPALPVPTPAPGTQPPFTR